MHGQAGMNWQKKGFIFAPQATRTWMHEYAQVPTPVVFDDFIRVFFSTRPRDLVAGMPVAYIGYVDVDRDDCTKVLRIADQPVLPLGDPGTFDEFGTHPVSALWNGDELWLYYVGWTRLTSVPYNRAIGLAISRDGGHSFERHGRGPIVGATPNEPYLQQGPSVRVFDGLWHMWYLTGLDWIAHAGRMESVYQIVHASSQDGIHWQRDGKPILPTTAEHECQAGQAVIYRNGRYHMWYSFRPGLDFRNSQRGYRMGYAVSDDLQHWQRNDSRAGIDVSAEGWDSGMVCYPQICEIGHRCYLFYSGNYFGRDGFGYAELQD